MEIQLQADLDENGRLTIGGVWGLATGGQVSEISFGLETAGNPAPLAISLVAPDATDVAVELASRIGAETAASGQLAEGFGGNASDFAKRAIYRTLIAEQEEIGRTINQCFERVIKIRAMFSALRGVE